MSRNGDSFDRDGEQELPSFSAVNGCGSTTSARRRGGEPSRNGEDLQNKGADPPLIKEVMTCIAYVYLFGTGMLRRVQATEEADSILRRIPGLKLLPSDVAKQAAMNGNDGAAEQELVNLSESQVESARDWNYLLQVAESILTEVRPWRVAAERAVNECNTQRAAAPRSKYERQGTLLSALKFCKLPDWVCVLFFALVIITGLGTEIICGMLYCYVSWPEFVTMEFAFITPTLAAFSLTFTFVIGPFVLLKFLPFGLDYDGQERFYKRFRLLAGILCLVAPVMFAWVLSIAKDYPPGLASDDPPWNPGMLGYVLVAMITVCCTTTAASVFLKAAVNNLYKLVEVTEPAYSGLEHKIGYANECLASCLALEQRAKRAIAAYQAAVTASKLSASNALAMYKSDREARKFQAYIIRKGV